MCVECNRSEELFFIVLTPAVVELTSNASVLLSSNKEPHTSYPRTSHPLYSESCSPSQ